MAESSKKLKITFCSGAQSVTGANYLLEDLETGRKFLIDCGLVQGEKIAEDTNWQPLPYDPREIEILFITHVHIDHIGRIPRLINEGFKGKIYSTLPSKDLAYPMLEDTMNILKRDTIHGLDKIYTEENIKKAMNLWQGFLFRETIDLGDGLTATFRNSGHILGSAMIEFQVNGPSTKLPRQSSGQIGAGKKIVFTGDLGNSPSPILPDTEEITDADYLIMESVYGDKNHESKSERKKKLEEVIEDNTKRKGTLMIPTFSLERTQELLFEINDLIENNRVPMVPFFLDSPLAIKLTDIYRKYSDYFNDIARQKIKAGDDIFVFPGLKETMETEQSKMILKMANPKIIIAGSGMSSGGRIIHHEKNYLPDPNNTILLTGYQSVGTLGRLIEEGVKQVRIEGTEVPIRARIVKIEGYSGHKDSDNLLKFVQNTSETIKKVFIVMGEPKSALFLVQKLRDYLAIDAVNPKDGESVGIDG